MKRLVAFMLVIAAAGFSATPATAQPADNWRTGGAGFQWDMTRPAINTSTATIAALGIIGGGALLSNSNTNLQGDVNYINHGGCCPYVLPDVSRAEYAGGGLLAGFSSGYLLAKFLPWPGSPGGRILTAPGWAAVSIAALGLTGSAWTIYEISGQRFDKCHRYSWSRYVGHICEREIDTAQKYAAGGLLVGISGGYLLATFLPRFQLPWPVAPVADTDTRTGAPLFGFAFTHPNARHRLELKTDMNAETAALHYRWRW